MQCFFNQSCSIKIPMAFASFCKELALGFASLFGILLHWLTVSQSNSSFSGILFKNCQLFLSSYVRMPRREAKNACELRMSSLA